MNWKEPDDVVEALFALCLYASRSTTSRSKCFMALSDLDRNRAQPLQPATVQRLVRGWSIYGAQYMIFGDAPGLSDKTIIAWLDNAEGLDKIHDAASFRQDTIGMVQALTGMWQIFCRQGSIPADKADETLLAIVTPFGTA